LLVLAESLILSSGVAESLVFPATLVLARGWVWQKWKVRAAVILLLPTAFAAASADGS
jgi:hypothetical protein